MMPLQYWVLLLVMGALDSIAFLYIAKAIRHMEISASSPFLVFGPVLIALLAFFFLKEQLTIQQLVGILLVIVGAYILEIVQMQKKKITFFEPFKVMIKSKYVKFIFFALFLYAITAVMARFMLSTENPLHIDPFALIFVEHVIIAVFFTVVLCTRFNGFAGIKHGLKMAGGTIFIMAVIVTGYRILGIIAKTFPVAKVGLIAAINRTSVLFATFIGGELFHDHHLKQKMVATVIMVIGVLLIVL